MLAFAWSALWKAKAISNAKRQGPAGATERHAEGKSPSVQKLSDLQEEWAIGYQAGPAQGRRHSVLFCLVRQCSHLQLRGLPHGERGTRRQASRSLPSSG